jgi:hypothetical protein
MRQAAPIRAYGLAGMGALALGVAVEIVQYFMHRDADPRDVLQDFWGIAAVLALHARWFASPEAQNRKRAWALQVTAAIAIVWACAPLVHCAAAYGHRSRQFPVIVDFQSSLDLYFLRAFDPPLARVRLPAQFSHDAREFTVFAPYGDHPWPGVVFEEPPPDWRGYRTLVIDVANPNPADLAMILTVHDRQYDGTSADRFDREFTLRARQRLVLRWIWRRSGGWPSLSSADRCCINPDFS